MPIAKSHRNIRHDPRIAVSITDVDDPYASAEFRGVVERIEENPGGALRRWSNAMMRPGAIPTISK